MQQQPSLVNSNNSKYGSNTPSSIGRPHMPAFRITLSSNISVETILATNEPVPHSPNSAERTSRSFQHRSSLAKCKLGALFFKLDCNTKQTQSKNTGA